MFSVFFGQYLLNKGVIDNDTLAQLLETSKKTRVKLGVLAINSGLMTADNVNKVNHLQMKKDLRFGELAMEEGYLTDAELEILLSVQASEHLKLSQTLIDEGIMTFDDVEFHLNKYRQQYSLSDEAFDALKSGQADTIIDTYLKFDQDPFKDLYQEYITLFFKNMIRFIDSIVRIDELIVIDSKQYDYIIKQDITGPKRIYTAFGGKSDVLVKFASEYADESFHSLDDYALDALGEFLNLNNGLYLVNLSDYGVDLSMSTQTVQKNHIIEANKVYCVPFYTSFGRIDLLISLNPIV